MKRFQPSRRFSFAIGMVVMVLVARATAQDCTSCRANTFSPFPTWSGDISVCIDTALANHETDMKAGFDYWKNTLAAVGYNINFSYSSSSSCQAQINVKSDSSVTAPYVALASPTTGIGVNPAFINNSQYGGSFWQALGGHEMGHVMGYREVTTPGCWAYTIMAAPTAPTFQLPPSLLCTDVLAAGDNYVNPGAEGNYSEPSQYEEDCYDVYLVVSLYQETWNANTNTLSISYVGSVNYFLFTDCSGTPPI